jgi:hypothetical protein
MEETTVPQKEASGQADVGFSRTEQKQSVMKEPGTAKGNPGDLRQQFNFHLRRTSILAGFADGARGFRGPESRKLNLRRPFFPFLGIPLVTPFHTTN